MHDFPGCIHEAESAFLSMRRDVQCGSKILPVAFVSVSLALRILLGILLPSFAFHKRIQCRKEKNSTFTYTHTIVAYTYMYAMHECMEQMNAWHGTESERTCK